MRCLRASRANSISSRIVSLEPSEYLADGACPVLEKDLQILPEGNLAQIQQTLERAGNRHGTLNELRHSLNISKKTGSPNEHFLSKETMVPVALEPMSDWMNKVTHEAWTVRAAFR